MIDTTTTEVKENSPRKRKILSKGEIPSSFTISQSSYKLIRKICDTGLGSVHCVQDTTSELIYAVKFSRVQQEWKGDNPVQEASILASLTEGSSHPNIIRFVGSGRVGGCFCTVLEYCPDEMYNFVSREGPCSDIDAKNIFRQLISAVQFSHAHGVCHLDLSLENMLLSGSKEIKLADFAAAQVLKKDGKLAPLRFPPGKVKYMAPEIFAKKSDADGYLADVWSCGVILFILLVGCPPYEAPSFSDARFRLVLRGNILALLKRWEKAHLVTPLALNLLKRMLCKQQDRISMTEISRHKWFQSEPTLEIGTQEDWKRASSSKGEDVWCAGKI